MKREWFATLNPEEKKRYNDAVAERHKLRRKIQEQSEIIRKLDWNGHSRYRRDQGLMK